MTITGKFASLEITEGNKSIAVLIYQDPDGAPTGYDFAVPEQTFGAISCDGMQIPTSQELLNWIVGHSGGIRVVLEHDDGEHVQGVAFCTQAKTPSGPGAAA